MTLWTKQLTNRCQTRLERLSRDKHSSLSVLIVNGFLPSQYPLGLPTNVRLGWKGFPETNTLAYLSRLSMRFYLVGEPHNANRLTNRCQTGLESFPWTNNLVYLSGLPRGFYPVGEPHSVHRHTLGWKGFPETNTLVYFVRIAQGILPSLPTSHCPQGYPQMLYQAGKTFQGQTLQLICQDCEWDSTLLANLTLPTGLPTNVRLGWKDFPGTNTLAYFVRIAQGILTSLPTSHCPQGYPQMLYQAGKTFQGQTLQLICQDCEWDSTLLANLTLPTGLPTNVRLGWKDFPGTNTLANLSGL